MKSKLYNGVEIPMLGLGTWQIESEKEAINSVKYALEIGYRHIDTAAAYNNEEFVGRGISESGINRNEIFLTTKLWNSEQGYDLSMKAFEKSIKKLKVDYLDLYLIHWPKGEKSKDAWRAMERLYNEKLIRAIGVSNFMQHHLEDLMQNAEIIPMVNQMEFHPYLVQPQLLEFCKSKKIQYESWSPLMRGQIFEIPELKEISVRYNRTASQIVLRWDIQMGVVTIPKSVNPKRIKENSEIFDFELTNKDMSIITSLDKNKRTGPDPDNFNF
jgi:diketogulonate reductase-like aldo/keto reductase